MQANYPLGIRYNRGMRFRKLRIAWSVFWGLAAVLLVMLCMRSYWWQDGFAYDRTSGLTSIYISTCPGGFWFETNADPPFPFGLMPRQPQIYSTPYSDSDCPELHSGFRPFTLYANTG